VRLDSDGEGKGPGKGRVVPADAVVAALGSEGNDHPARRQPGQGGPRCPPVRFEVVNAGSIADAAQLLIEAVPAGCFCAGCEAIVTAADICCKCANWGTISRELRQGRELQLLSLELA
jgi:hypothetical protein